MTETRYDKEAADAARWWRLLRPQELESGARLPGDRATVARLRRASSLMEAATEPATATLFKALGFKNATRDLPRAALVAAVLAHVRDDDRATLARALGSPADGSADEARLKPLRFKRLVAAREPDDLLIAFRRTVAILGHTANVKDLARSLIAWTDPDERQADIARTRFAFDYHGAAQYAPADNGNDASDTDTDTEKD